VAESPFETLLRAQIRDVLDGYAGPHPVWTDSPAAMRNSERRRRGGWPIRLLGVAALLAIGGGVLSQAGSRQPWTDEPSPSPGPMASTAVGAPEIPDILRGQFAVQVADPSARDAANAYPWYFVDLADNVLVHGPGKSDDPAEMRPEDGTAADWAGRVVQFTPLGVRSAAVVIQAPPPCGDARYVVRYDVAPRRDQPWTLTFTQPQDQCADRLEILVGSSATMDLPSASPGTVAPSSSATQARAWSHQPIRLASGKRYASWSFTEPFHFVMPPEDLPPSAWTWLAPGHIHFSHPYWFGDLFDDRTLPIDHCDPSSGSLADVPAGPQALESWLRSNGLAIVESAEAEVDGRTAVRYDTSELPRDCPGQSREETDWNAVRFLSRWYLIPTGDDTILFNVYGDTETELQVADGIVGSMIFDDR
jgi:hypothetical protein